MKNTRHASAFSLIEISIVILIIGILVAGISQSSRLISAAKLSNAKTLTQSAPVASIKNLVLWLETTSDASFNASDTDDNATITTWNDINPQTVSKVTFTSSGAPKYKTNLINGLPAVCFNNSNCGSGTADHFTTSGFSNLTSGITIFAVVKTPDTLAAEPLLSKRNNNVSYNIPSSSNFQLNTATNANGAWQFCDGSTQSGSNVTCTLAASATVVAKSNYVVSLVYNTSSIFEGTTSTGITFFQNGTLSGSLGTDSITTSLPPATIPEATSPLLIGRVSTNGNLLNQYFKGYIGEIIIFDRALKKEERQSIESYLGKKWGINMTTAAI